jgi:hypothetical protein
MIRASILQNRDCGAIYNEHFFGPRRSGGGGAFGASRSRRENCIPKMGQKAAKNAVYRAGSRLEKRPVLCYNSL